MSSITTTFDLSQLFTIDSEASNGYIRASVQWASNWLDFQQTEAGAFLKTDDPREAWEETGWSVAPESCPDGMDVQDVLHVVREWFYANQF